MMATSEKIQDLSDEQVVHSALDAERSLVGMRFRHSMSTLENTADLGNLRKRIARLKTEARRRELAQGLRKDALFQQHGKSFRKEAAAAGSSEAPAKGGFLSGIVDKLTGKD